MDIEKQLTDLVKKLEKKEILLEHFIVAMQSIIHEFVVAKKDFDIEVKDFYDKKEHIEIRRKEFFYEDLYGLIHGKKI